MTSPKKKVVRASMGILALIGLAGVVLAVDEFNWDHWFAPAQTKILSITTAYSEFAANGPGPVTVMEVTRSPVAGAQFTLQAKATIQAVGVLTSYKLEFGEDLDANGVITAGEWTTVATATISQAGGVTTATTGAIPASTSSDGFRVVMVRSDLADPIVEHVLLGDVDVPW